MKHMRLFLYLFERKMLMKCFYHSDADGRCAGYWVANLAHLTEGRFIPANMIEINYNQPFPFDIIRPNEQIYIVDFSISPDEMLRLLDVTKDVTWIDHHITAIEKYKDFPYTIRGVRVDGIAGCMLTYCYLQWMTLGGLGPIADFEEKMIDTAPRFTKLVADWDACNKYKPDGNRDFKYGDDTTNFITAFNASDFSPLSKKWEDFRVSDNRRCDYLIGTGIIMNQFRDSWAKEYCKSKGFETMLAGHRCFALNLGLCNSEYFKSVDDSMYDIFIAFSFNGTKWVVSLYSTKVDVSEIAKKLGGGGHKGAAGFQCDLLPFIED